MKNATVKSEKKVTLNKYHRE